MGDNTVDGVSEIICDKCDGTGHISNSEKDEDNELRLLKIKPKCPKCHGKGTVDWIENIVGKTKKGIEPGVYIQEIDMSHIIAPHIPDVLMCDYTDLLKPNSDVLVETQEDYKKLFGAAKKWMKERQDQVKQS